MKPNVTNSAYALFFFNLYLVTWLVACTDDHNIPNNAVRHATDSAYAANISHDGQYSLVSSIHHGLSLWENPSNAVKYHWSHHDNHDNLVLITSISPNNSHAISADLHNFVLWDIQSGQSAAYINIHQARIRDVALSNHGKQILIGMSDGKALLIDTMTGRRLEFIGHQEKVNSVDISDNGQWALTGSNDYSAFLWDTKSAQIVHRFNHPSRVTKVVFDHGRRYLFTADSRQQAQVWDILSGKPISRLRHGWRQFIVTAARFSQNGQYLVTGSPTRRLVLWDVATGKPIQTWTVAAKSDRRSPSSVIHSVAFINNDSQILTESSSGLAEVWDID